MAGSEERAFATALQLLDGEEPDWASLEALADSEDRATIEGLRTLQSVLRVGPGDDPRVWGDLRILGRIGGGMEGDVYRAWDDRLGREVALKLLRPVAEPAASEALLDEARRLAQLKHAGIVAVYGADRREGRVGFWMELLSGRTLSAVLSAHGRFGAPEAAHVGVDLCRSLAAVHAAGQVHRDLKADNVVREEGGRLVLTDFGSATLQAALGAGVAGTPLYMAPEVLAGAAPDAGSDLYSLGVLLYHLTSGGYPVEADTVAGLREAHGAGRRTYLRDLRPDLPAPFVDVVEKSVAPAAADRYRSAGEMEAALLRALEPTRPQQAASVVLLLAATLAVALAGWWWMRPAAPPSPQHPAASEGTTAIAPVTLRLLAMRDDAPARMLADGDAVAPGDRLSLEVQSTVDTHVYVVDEDERGHAYLLFPLPEDSERNPLAGGRRHRLPGAQHGQALDWQVTSAGGREHILVLASRERQPAFEQVIARLPVAAIGRPVSAVPVEPGVAGRLRGIGGLVEVTGDGSPRPIRPALVPFAGDVARGPWLREIVLTNPR
jgi:hypothetical protein